MRAPRVTKFFVIALILAMRITLAEELELVKKKELVATEVYRLL